MSIITMNTTGNATFTDLMKERLESVLISMLDSGTMSEEHAMAANESMTLLELRKALDVAGTDAGTSQHIVKMVMGQYDIEMVSGHGVDLSEFFKCNTPEEAKALRSWAEVFDVVIPTTMSVIEEKPMKSEFDMYCDALLEGEDVQKPENVRFTEDGDVVPEGARYIGGDVYAYEVKKEEKPMKTAKDVSREFKAIVEARNSIESSQIILDGIELKSSGAIATALVHALEKDGFYQQYLPEEDKTDAHQRYAFMSKAPGFDNRMVALLAVQLAGVLPYLDAEYDFEHVVATAVFRRRFRDIARANSFIPGAFHNMMDAAGTTHWHEKLRKGLELAIKAGLIDEREEDGVCYIKHSQKYIGSCISRTSIMHKSEEISLDNRRKERVKGRSNPRKDGTSKEVREALDYIESQAQKVNTWLLDAINGVLEYCTSHNMPVPAVFNESRHVIHGSNELRGNDAIYSEYFMDLRGRMYQFAHAGPNPQASDMAKALCYHTVSNRVSAGTEQHEMFLNEFFNEVIGDKDSVWATEAYIRRTAEAPVNALVHAFSTNNGELPFKKFFTYMDMCCTWVDFEDNGSGDSRLGFGPDAKCSGAQIFSILAGCETMAKACGLITGYDVKPADPYNMSAQEVNKITAGLIDAGLCPSRTITRNEIKTPFMAIQYGGGTPALRYKKFEPTMEALGIAPTRRDDFCKNVVIKGINNAMGTQIGDFIEALRGMAAEYCEKHNVDYFEYRHIDGYLVTKKGEANVGLTKEPFIINYGVDGQGVIFGSKEKGEGWAVESRTSGPLQRQNFVYYFPVHFIQGLDAVMARKIALGAKKAGLRGYSTIHDQFRTCLEDAPRLRAEVVPAVYEDMFINNDPVAHLCKQTGIEMAWGNPLKGRVQVLTKEILFSKDAYYFE